MFVPSGSLAVFDDDTAAQPSFTPDVAGMYTVSVWDIAEQETVDLDIYAGTWVGTITGQDWGRTTETK